MEDLSAHWVHIEMKALVTDFIKLVIAKWEQRFKKLEGIRNSRYCLTQSVRGYIKNFKKNIKGRLLA